MAVTTAMPSFTGATPASPTVPPGDLLRMEISATLRNVFDVSYADPASNDHPMSAIPQPGRSVWLRAAINL